MSEQDINQAEIDSKEPVEDILEDENLLEVKASMGDPSEVPDPVAIKAKKNKGDKTDSVAAHDPEGGPKDEKPVEVTSSMPKTKAGMINAAIQLMQSARKGNLEKNWENLTKSLTDEYDEHDGESISEEEIVQTNSKPIAKISVEDIDVADDIHAMFGSEELDEQFKEKAKTIFEAALVAKVNEKLEDLAVEAEADVEATSTAAVDELTEKVDTYLDYVVNEWVEDNKLAIEQGVRADIVEDFMKGLKGLFTEHYIDIPEEKVDIVEELVSKVEELETKINAETDKNVELSGIIKDAEKEKIFAESTKGLVDTQVEKLRGLADGVEFSDTEDFNKKLDMLKENYFDIGTDDMKDSVVTDDGKEPVALDADEKEHTGAMAAYMGAISRSVKN